MNKFKEWIQLIINYFRGGTVGEFYINPLDFYVDLDELQAQAVVMDKQRTLKLKMKEESKTLLNGYTPPKPFVANRIDLHMEQAGIVGKEKKDRFGPIVKFTATKESKKQLKN